MKRCDSDSITIFGKSFSSIGIESGHPGLYVSAPVTIKKRRYFVPNGGGMGFRASIH